jgi:monofunctional chorismate mutase
MTTSENDTESTRRHTIDTIDSDIIRLIQRRQDISAAIQRARVADGRPRLHQAREIAILKRYSRHLGKPGTALASAILDVCRGKLGAAG